MNYTDKTKLSQILAAYPWLSRELPRLDSRFAAINSFAGKLMLKTMTLGDLSRLSGETVEKLVQELEEIIRAGDPG